MNNMNMNLLKYFYYVAKYNSYTKAAEAMGDGEKLLSSGSITMIPETKNPEGAKNA